MSAIIATYSGAKIDVTDPDPDGIHLEDIARGLSWLPRYRAQTSTLYAVSAHCVNLARYVQQTYPPGTRNTAATLYALLHDAPEAYVGDLPYPLRGLAPALAEIERKLMRVIWQKLTGLQWPTQEEIAFVTEADRRIVGDEWRKLMPHHDTDGIPEPLGADLYIGHGANAYKMFIGMADALGVR